MKKILFICCLAASLTGFAQDEKEKHYEPSNWFTGGSISLGYSGGSYSSFLAGIHPHYGYTIAKWLDAAAVANFEYQSQRDPYYNYKYHNTTYGFGAFTRIYPVHFLFLQAEPEYNFIDVKAIDQYGNSSKAKLHATSLLLGGGYTTSRSGKNSFSYVSVLFDVLKNVNSPYVDGNGSIVPVIRAGINIGLNRKSK